MVRASGLGSTARVSGWSRAGVEVKSFALSAAPPAHAGGTACDDRSEEWYDVGGLEMEKQL